MSGKQRHGFGGTLQHVYVLRNKKYSSPSPSGGSTATSNFESTQPANNPTSPAISCFSLLHRFYISNCTDSQHKIVSEALRALLKAHRQELFKGIPANEDKYRTIPVPLKDSTPTVYCWATDYTQVLQHLCISGHVSDCLHRHPTTDGCLNTVDFYTTNAPGRGQRCHHFILLTR